MNTWIIQTSFFLSMVVALVMVKADGTQNSLVVSIGESFREISLDDSGRLSETQDILPGGSNTGLVDYDPTTGYLYWSDISTNQIKRAHLDGSGQETLVQEPSSEYEGIAVDWLAQNLYFVDVARNHIVVMGLQTKSQKIIVSTNMENPRAIQIDPVEGYIFWTDWGKSTIERSFLDGTGRDVIVLSGLKWPNGLAIDRVAKMIYWVDGGLASIGMADYQGRNRRTLFTSTTKVHMFDVTLLGDYLYWTSWSSNSVERTHRFTGEGREAILQRTHREPMGIVAVVPNLSNNEGTNECATRNSPCDNLCLYKPPPHSTVCARPDNEGTDKMLLIASRKTLAYISLDTSPDRFTAVPIDAQSTTTSVFLDYHYDSNTIYFSNHVDDSISKVKLDGTEQEVVLTGENGPEGLAIDWISGNLYWSNPDKHKISVSLLNGSFPIDVVTELGAPRAICLDPENGYMYWTDWGIPAIEKSFLDGTRREAIVTTDLGYPNGLAVDLVEGSRRLYWADGKTDRLESCNLDGSGRKVLVSVVHHVFGLTMLDDYIYWTDWYTRRIERANKHTGGNRTKVYDRSDLIQLMGLKAVDLNRPPTGTNTCGPKNGGCSHLCLYRPSPLSHVCACPDGMVLYVKAQGARGICFQGQVDSTNTTPSTTTTTTTTTSSSSSGSTETIDDSNSNGTTVVQCTPGEVLQGDEKPCANATNLSCPINTIGCQSDDSCIPVQWKCDGELDCFDGSDENNCEHDEAQVKNNTDEVGFPNNSNRTDAIFNRTNNVDFNRTDASFNRTNNVDFNKTNTSLNITHTTDEVPIPTSGSKTLTCPPEHTACLTSGGNASPPNCIPLRWKCDGEKDCKDGSDEENCNRPRTCPPNHIMCLSAASDDESCIPEKWKCDGEDDCKYGFDERNCGYENRTTNNKRAGLPENENQTTCPPESPFTCTSSSTCIPIKWKCDGVNDCADGSDEKDCQHPITCPPDSFMCLSNGSNYCILLKWKCDGENDCTDGYDEKYCDLDESKPTDQTNNNTSISTTVVDGAVSDVSGSGSDNVSGGTTCNSQQISCLSTGGGGGGGGSNPLCIPRIWKCDGAADCSDGSDEKNCEDTTCPPKTVRCQSGGLNSCIPVHWKCDGDADCDDAFDEKNCEPKNQTNNNNFNRTKTGTDNEGFNKTNISFQNRTHANFNRTNMDFNRTELDFNRTNAGFNRTELDFNRTNAGFNRTELNFNRTNMDFNRTELDFNRTNAGFNRTELNFNRTNMDFNRTELDFNRTNAGFNRTELNFNRTHMDYNRTELNFNRTNAGFNRTELNFNRTNMDFNRTELDFNRTNAASNRTELDFNRTNADFNRTELDFNSTHYAASNKTSPDFNGTHAVLNSTETHFFNSTTTDQINFTTESPTDLSEEVPICPCDLPQTSTFLVDKFCMPDTLIVVRAGVKQVKYEDDKIFLELRKKKTMYKNVKVKNDDDEDNDGEVASSPEPAAAAAGADLKVAVVNGDDSCSCVNVLQRRKGYLLMGKMEGDDKSLVVSYIIPVSSPEFRTGVRLIQQKDACVVHLWSQIEKEWESLTSGGA